MELRKCFSASASIYVLCNPDFSPSLKLRGSGTQPWAGACLARHSLSPPLPADTRFRSFQVPTRCTTGRKTQHQRRNASRPSLRSLLLWASEAHPAVHILHPPILYLAPSSPTRFSLSVVCVFLQSHKWPLYTPASILRSLLVYLYNPSFPPLHVPLITLHFSAHFILLILLAFGLPASDASKLPTRTSHP
ncbi:hypothetical protein F5Y08DRAFT_56369 [Xylaria arbuscula]|nr:hypothetical protein F5Y08DRAFT_56369 [Xylaria arbuscula]